MAITVLAQPQAFMPVYDPAYWTASSTQTAQPNFEYTVVFTDLITSATITKPFKKRPSDNKLVFDSNFFAEAYTLNYVPNNVYGWQKCTDAIRKIRVNIGETYGTTPTYYPGSNIDYIVWNGVILDKLELPTYNYTNYVYNSFTTNYKYLSNFYEHTTYDDKSLFFYLLSTGSGDFGSLRIDTYDENNAFIATSYIANPYAASGTYTDKYLCIDVGHKGLSQISSGLVTGAYPIITASVARYELINMDNSAKVMNVTIGCEAKCEPFVLQALFANGRYESVPFPKVSEINNETVKTTYSRNPYSLVSNVYKFSTFSGHEITLNSTTKVKLTLNTDWLTYEEIAMFAEIVDSASVYIDYGSTIGLVPVQVETSSYKKLKKWNSGNPYFQITVRQGYTNNKQRG